MYIYVYMYLYVFVLAIYIYIRMRPSQNFISDRLEFCFCSLDGDQLVGEVFN